MCFYSTWDKYLWKALNSFLLFRNSSHHHHPGTKPEARDTTVLKFHEIKGLEAICKPRYDYQNFALLTEDRRFMTSFLLLFCKSSIWFTKKHIFKIIIYFFDTSKCAANYVILNLWRQKSWPFGPGGAAHIASIQMWTFPLPCSTSKWK